MTVLGLSWLVAIVKQIKVGRKSPISLIALSSGASTLRTFQLPKTASTDCSGRSQVAIHIRLVRNVRVVRNVRWVIADVLWPLLAQQLKPWVILLLQLTGRNNVFLVKYFDRYNHSRSWKGFMTYAICGIL